MTYEETLSRVETLLDNLYIDEDALRGALDAIVNKAHEIGLTEAEIGTMLAMAVQ